MIERIGFVSVQMTRRGLRTSFLDGSFRDLDGPDAEDEGAEREVKDGAEEGEQQILKREFWSAVVTRDVHVCTGLNHKVVSRLRECCRQGQAEVVSKSNNKLYQTWGPPFN